MALKIKEMNVNPVCPHCEEEMPWIEAVGGQVNRGWVKKPVPFAMFCCPRCRKPFGTCGGA